MDLTARCQSCGMALGEGFYGTAADGSRQPDYCRFCFEGGEFVDPRLTLAEMMLRSVRHMTRELHVPRAHALRAARDILPRLKRWKGATVPPKQSTHRRPPPPRR